MKKIFYFLIILIIGLGRTQKIKDLYSEVYNDQHIQNDNQGIKQTIHTLKGHYNEEVNKFILCSNSNSQEINATDEMPLDMEKTISSETEALKKLNKSSDTEKVEDEPNINDSYTKSDTDENILFDILRSGDNPASRQLNTEIKLPFKNLTAKLNSANELKDTRLDTVHKNFEFESLIITNDADNDGTRIYNNLDLDDDSDKNNTRRFNAYGRNQGQLPINYYNPFVNEPPRSIIPSRIINPSLNLKFQATNPNNNIFNDPYPIANKKIDNNQFAAIDVMSSSSEVTSEYKERLNKRHDVNDDSDIDFITKPEMISYEDVKNYSRSDPTKGFGISEMYKTNMMLIEHPRVCFACSSTNNPSCWSPNRSTPAKYCRRDHNACVIKTYRHRGYAFIIRDCDDMCQDKGLSELDVHYQSCTICHADLCNSAFSVKLDSFNTIIFVVLTMSYLVTT